MTYKMGGSLRLSDRETGREVPIVVSYDGHYWMPNPELVDIGMKDYYEELCERYYKARTSNQKVIK